MKSIIQNVINTKQKSTPTTGVDMLSILGGGSIEPVG